MLIRTLFKETNLDEQTLDWLDERFDDEDLSGVNDWKGVFIKLITTSSLTDFDIACRIKLFCLPEKLYRFRSIKTCEEFERRLSEIELGKIYCMHPKKLNDPLEMKSILTKEDCDDPSIVKRNELLNGILSISRIVCFTESWSNLPMWEFYANEHKGICLEYDLRSFWGYDNDYHFRNRLHPVIYVDELPNLTEVNLKNVVRSGFGLDVHAYFYKLRDWGYEKEWRLVFTPDSKTQYAEAFEVEDFIKPSRVILGTNCLPCHEKKLHNSTKAAGIDIAKVKVMPYGLSVDELNG